MGIAEQAQRHAERTWQSSSLVRCARVHTAAFWKRRRQNLKVPACGIARAWSFALAQIPVHQRPLVRE